MIRIRPAAKRGHADHGWLDTRHSFSFAGVWIQVISGRLRVGEHELNEGDGAALDDEPSIAIEAAEQTELLLFDLA